MKQNLPCCLSKQNSWILGAEHSLICTCVVVSPQKDATLKTPERLELRMKHSGKRKRDEGNNSEPEDEDGSSEKGRSRSCGGERALRKRSKRRHKEVRSWRRGKRHVGE